MLVAIFLNTFLISKSNSVESMKRNSDVKLIRRLHKIQTETTLDVQ